MRLGGADFSLFWRPGSAARYHRSPGGRRRSASRVHAHEAPVEPTPDAACVWCHAAYARRATGGTAQRFCSAACRQAFHTAARRHVAREIDEGRLDVATACTLGLGAGEEPRQPWRRPRQYYAVADLRRRQSRGLRPRPRHYPPLAQAPFLGRNNRKNRPPRTRAFSLWSKEIPLPTS